MRLPLIIIALVIIAALLATSSGCYRSLQRRLDDITSEPPPNFTI